MVVAQIFEPCLVVLVVVVVVVMAIAISTEPKVALAAEAGVPGPVQIMAVDLLEQAVLAVAVAEPSVRQAMAAMAAKVVSLSTGKNNELRTN